MYAKCTKRYRIAAMLQWNNSNCEEVALSMTSMTRLNFCLSLNSTTLALHWFQSLFSRAMGSLKFYLALLLPLVRFVRNSVWKILNTYYKACVMGRKITMGTGSGPKLLRVIKPTLADPKIELVNTVRNARRLTPCLDFKPTGTIPQPSMR